VVEGTWVHLLTVGAVLLAVQRAPVTAVFALLHSTGTRACAQDPTVQRAYAGCAEGYGFKIDPFPPHDPQKKGIGGRLLVGFGDAVVRVLVGRCAQQLEAEVA